MDTKSNKEQDFSFSKAELTDFKLFWESAVGKKYKDKITRTKEQLLDAAMGTPSQDEIVRFTCIANGLASILNDIEATIDAANKDEKEGNTAKDAK